jgi:hypothetical protein
MRAWAPLLLIPLATACAGSADEPATRGASLTSAGFTASEIRQPAVFVRVTLAAGTFGARERTLLPAVYEGALLEGLNSRAVPPRDLQRVTTLEPRIVLARTRDVGADHAILVDVRVERGEPIFCRESRRPFRASATSWVQSVEVLRSSDGTRRLTLSGTALTVTDLQADCGDPRASHRRSSTETAADGVNLLLTRLLGP